jgi:hypothetical protein
MADLGVWGLWWAVGGAVVLVAALLLIWILLAARGIEREARRALAAARQVEANTRPIWRLADVREALEAVEARTARRGADRPATAGKAEAER